MYLTRMIMFLSCLPSVYSTNHSQMVSGYDPDYVEDIPRYLQGTRKHCFDNPHLSCSKNRKCCTHNHQKQIWCCERHHNCGKIPRTCVIPHLH